MAIYTKKVGFIIGLLTSLGFTALGVFCAWLAVSNQTIIPPSEQTGVLYGGIGVAIGIGSALAGLIFNYFCSRR